MPSHSLRFRADTPPAPAETNRKCPRWAEFNSGTPPLPSGSASSGGGGGGAASPPAGSPPGAGLLGVHPANAMMSHGPSPLAMSPPVTAVEDEDADAEDEEEDEGAAGPRKLKFTLKR